MSYPKMKPCPKCSSAVSVYTYYTATGAISSSRAECDYCDYIGSCEGRKLDAIREHNRRVVVAQAEAAA